jgi:hypothetical protein
MSDAWFHDADERAALVEAEKVGTTIEKRGPRYLLRLMSEDDGQHFDTLEELRAEVKARLKQRPAATEEVQAPAAAPEPPQQTAEAEPEPEPDEDTHRSRRRR